MWLRLFWPRVFLDAPSLLVWRINKARMIKASVAGPVLDWIFTDAISQTLSPYLNHAAIIPVL